MVTKNECIQIGDKYYLFSDVQSVLEVRIKSVVPEDINEE
jgi:hypothetical protein